MHKIYCLIGKSGTGKDTLYHNILRDQAIEITPIIPYTTRPKRENEEEGVQYHFVTEEELERLKEEGRIVEQRCYETIRGRWCYSTVDCGTEPDRSYLTITTPEAAAKIADWYGHDRIVIIYLELDARLRLERTIERESGQTEPNYAELCRRFLADEKDFSMFDRLKDEGINLPWKVFVIHTDRSEKDCTEEFRRIMDEV